MADLADAENALLTMIADALFQMPLATDGGQALTTDSGAILTADSGLSYVPGTLMTSVVGAAPGVASTLTTDLGVELTTDTGASLTTDVSGLVGGLPVRLYRGWPPSAPLIADLRAGISNVTIYPVTGMARNTTRFNQNENYSASMLPTLRLAGLVPGLFTVNGTPAAGQICGVRIGNPPASAAYAYAVKPNDTCATIATALAALVPGASASGAIVTLPTVAPAVVRCFQSATAATEVRRQVQQIRVSVWAPTHDNRDALAAACDLAIAPYPRITLQTGETLYQRYTGTLVSDIPSRNEAWLRSLVYAVEYPTNVFAFAPEMLFGISNLNSNPTAE